MTTIYERIEEYFSQNEVLPLSAEKAVSGMYLVKKIREYVGDNELNEYTIRTYLSNMAKDPSSPVAKVDQGHGYYRRILDEETEKEEGGERKKQREKKFRAVFIKYEDFNNRFPKHIEHTRGKKSWGSKGINQWKFPDVVVLEWEPELIEENIPSLDSDVLEVKRSLGEPPFRLMNVELKTEVTQSKLREYFFQCVSNSKWAHVAQLAIASTVTDEALAEQLRRLGSSYDVSVVTYGLDRNVLDNLPDASVIKNMKDEEYPEEILHNIHPNIIHASQGRETLDWGHIRDLREQTKDFNEIFSWVADV